MSIDRSEAIAIEHTPEPWHQCAEPELGALILDGKQRAIGDCDGPPNAHENARRIVACVNACAGIPTEELEGHRWAQPSVNRVDVYVLERTP